jgi:hypothetical protein
MENNKNTDKKSIRLKNQQKLSANSENITLKFSCHNKTVQQEPKLKLINTILARATNLFLSTSDVSLCVHMKNDKRHIFYKLKIRFHIVGLQSIP